MRKTYDSEHSAVLFYHDGVGEKNIPLDIEGILSELEPKPAVVNEAWQDHDGLHLRLMVDEFPYQQHQLDYTNPNDIEEILNVFGQGVKEERIPELRYRDVREDDLEQNAEHIRGIGLYTYVSKTLGLVAISDRGLHKKLNEY